MKTKRIDFDVDLAKKITNGEENGRIVTEDGNNVRIICWDAKLDDCCVIIALFEYKGNERVNSYTEDGKCTMIMESTYGKNLMIEIPFASEDLKPFDKVLVRNNDCDFWIINLFSHIRIDYNFKYCCLNDSFKQCIPYDGNEHLLGTTNSTEE